MPLLYRFAFINIMFLNDEKGVILFSNGTRMMQGIKQRSSGMEFKIFMQAVEHRMDEIKSESELRKWLLNYARTIPENDREAFLEKFVKKEYQTHRRELEEIEEWCRKVEEGEITLSSYGYEDYDGPYWGDNWVTEYEDPYGIGHKLEKFYEIAEQCVYDRDYDTAHSIYQELGSLSIMACDESMEDSFDLGLDELNAEGITNLNLKRITALTLYSQYQVSKPEERARDIYNCFFRQMFKETKIEDMMSAGTEPLQGIDEFIESWISYLREQKHEFTARLLKEAVIYKAGDEGLLQEARRCAVSHPELYIESLEKLYSAQSWEKLAEEGKEALRLMDREMKIRGKAARLAAAGARGTGDKEGEKQAYFEGFYSELSTDNYLRLITSEKVGENDLYEVGRRIESVRKNQKMKMADFMVCSYRQDSKPHYELGKRNYLEIIFYSGKFDEILSECKKEKTDLGWSGEFINEGVPMLLLVLCRNQLNGRAMRAILSELESDAGYREMYGEPTFTELITQWGKAVDVSKELEKHILDYLQKTIDSRVTAIVSGGHRKSYYKAAELGAALGEAEEAQGISQAKERRIRKYFEQFPRHRAFKDEMKAYM